MANKIFISIGVIALIILFLVNGYFLFQLSGSSKEEPKRGDKTRPDTVIVKEVEKIKIVERAVPYAVEKQVDPDTALRNALEKYGNIITGVELRNNKLEVSRIDTAGRILKEIHETGVADHIKIDSSGAVEILEDKKKKRREKIKKIIRTARDGAILIGAVWLGSKL